MHINKRGTKNKICRMCQIPLTADNQYPSYVKSKDNVCITCAKERHKIRHSKNKDKNNAQSREYRAKLKADTIYNYGGKCECCGEDQIEFLTIDHINEDGAQERKRLFGHNRCAGIHFYIRLKKNGYPKENYRVLCYNCNCATYFRGSCHGEYIISEKATKSFFVRNNPNDKEKKCYKCGIILNDKNWYKRSQKIRRNECISCLLADRKALSDNNARKVIIEYGGKCACCGEDNIRLLTIDHIYNDGAENRKKTGSGSTFYSWLIRNNFPKGRLQVLCFNCNCCKGSYGCCVHNQNTQL